MGGEGSLHVVCAVRKHPQRLGFTMEVINNTRSITANCAVPLVRKNDRVASAKRLEEVVEAAVLE